MAERTTVEILSTVAFPEPLLEQLREISPRVRVKMQPVQQATEIADEVWEKTEVLYTATVLPEPAKVPNLRWVQFHLAGVEYALDANLLKQPQIRFTTLSARCPSGGRIRRQHVLALGTTSGNDGAERTFRVATPSGVCVQPARVARSTVGIVGYGSIGARWPVAAAFHPTILAAKAT